MAKSRSPTHTEAMDEHRWLVKPKSSRPKHPAPDANWNEDGRWAGPADLRLFLRSNRLFALWWLIILTFISLGVIADLLPQAFWGWHTPFLALGMGSAVTLLAMFAFSRGWIGDGD
jgi:hypothetical protein